MPLFYSNFKSSSNKISRIVLFEQLLYVAFVSLIAKVKMALCLVGNTGRGQIWVGLSSVMSKEAPIPPAPSCEAAQPNHGHPTVYCVQYIIQNFKVTAISFTVMPLMESDPICAICCCAVRVV